MDMDEKLLALQQRLRYYFRNSKLAAEAMNTGGAAVMAVENRDTMINKNDRLAVYGDVAMTHQLCRLWRDNDLPGATWDSIRQERLSKEALAEIGFQHRLNDCVILQRGTTNVSPKMMATTVGAILGAVHLDGGDHALQAAMNHLGVDSHPRLPTT